MSSTSTDLQQLLRYLIPVGGIVLHTGTLPTGFLECDGREVSRVRYASLFGVISTAWGMGDGSSTFCVPMLRPMHISQSTTIPPESVSPVEMPRYIIRALAPQASTVPIREAAAGRGNIPRRATRL